MDEKIGTGEASEILGLTRARVSQLCKAGDLSADFLSNVWLIDKKSVERLAQKRKDKKLKKDVVE